MYIRFATIFALLSAPLIAFAQSSDGPNAFKVPTGGYSATVGQPLDLEWTPTTDGTVSLVLRSGESADLDKGVTIASHIANSGSYTWIPANNFPSGSDYAIEIVDDSDSTQVNYTPQFPLEGGTGIPATASSSSGTASSTSGTTGTATTETSGSSSGSSASESVTGTTITMDTMTTGSAVSTSGVGPGRASMSTGASFQPTTQSSSQGSAARATAMAGMLGAVALGAFAL